MTKKTTILFYCFYYVICVINNVVLKNLISLLNDPFSSGTMGHETHGQKHKEILDKKAHFDLTYLTFIVRR